MTLTEAELEAATSLPETPILCPYFSAFIEGSDQLPPACYVLGQAAVAGRTTLRRCTLAGHYSLGDGSRPVLEDFVALLPEAHTYEVRGATMLDPSARTSLDEQLLKDLNPVKP